MNKIYRRLWSTARQCWVVASELTSPRGKANQTVGKGLLAISLMTGSAAALAEEKVEHDAARFEDSHLLWAMHAAFGARSMPVSPAGSSLVGTLNTVHQQVALTTDNAYRNSTVSGNHLVILGSRSSLSGNQSVAYGNLITSRGDNNTAIGHGVQLTGGGYATGVGAAAVANGIGATALGNDARANTQNSIAVGSGSRTDSGAGISKIAIGGNAYAGTGGWTGAIALGGAARAEYDSVAIGYEAKTSATMSVALGRGSIATESNTVSVGSAGKERRIVNVKDGAINGSSTDAVNGRQLSSARDLAQRGVNDAATAQRVATGAKSTADQALANSILVTQTSAASGIRIGGENTGNVLTVSNKNGDLRYLNGVRNGTLSTTSTDAVTGQQLFATNNNVTTAQNTANNALGKANALGGLVSQAAANGNVRLGGENTGAVLDVRNKSNANRTMSGLKDGAVNGTSTEAVTGKQLNTTNTEVAAARTVATSAQTTASTAKTTADSALGKANTLGGLVSQAAADGNVRLGGENTGAVLDVRNKANANRTLSGLKDGAVNATSTEAVTGKQLNTTNTEVASVRTVATAAQTAANTAKSTADNALGKANTLGGLVSQIAADGNVRLGAANTGTELDVRNKSNANRTLSGLKDGAVNATSTEAVTGKQLNTINTEVASVRTVATAAQTTASAAKSTADNALGKANTLGGLVSQVAADGNVRLGGENTGAVLDVRNKSNASRTLTGLKEGAVNASSTEAVTGKQLFATNEKVQANEGVLAGHSSDLAAQSGRITDNRRDLDALRSEFEDFDPDLDGVVKFGADGSVDIVGGKLRGVAAGDISTATSTDAVNGGQLFATNERIASMEYGGRFFKIGTDEYSEDAYAGWFGVAIGESAEASRFGEGGVAVGAYARALGTNSVALGRGSTVLQGATKGFALGAGSRVEAEGGAAFGADSKVMGAARGSIAIGEGSIADEAGTVSVGGEGLVRRITNVGRGVGLSDASTVAQLDDALRNLGAGAGMDGSGNIIAPTYNVHGGTQNNVGDALAALDSAMVTADSRVDNLEGKLRSAFQDGPSVRADGLNQLVLAGANGSVLTNLADGRIAAGSRDAVNGSQLFAAKQEIARNRSDLDDMKRRESNSGLGAIHSESSVLGDVDFGGARLTGVSDGRVSSTSSDVVTGAQLFGTNERVSNLETSGRVVAVSSANEWNSQAKIGMDSVAVGEYAAASVGSEGGTAVGHYARADSRNSVAIGQSSSVSSRNEGGVAIGSRARADGPRSAAIGDGAWVFAGADNSVAVGAGSESMRSNEFAIGSYSNRRRLTHVASGIASYDAATAGQLRESLEVLGGGSTLDAQGSVVAPTYRVQDGVQRSVGDALASLDSAVVTNTTRTDRVESQLRAVFQDSPTVRNDGLNQLTFAGANGMVLSNVANGAIAAGSRDAVNGGQLHSMQQQLNGRMDGLEQRIDGQPQTPQLRALTVAAVDSAASSVPAATPAADEPTAPPPSSSDNKVVADAGNAPKSSPQPKADAPQPEAPTPQVDTADLEKMLARANEYTDGISREVDRRLDKMDKRFNRMAAMGSAQSAMAMNTAGLNTYNRLGAGVGYSEGESAMAVGYQRVLNDKGSATFSLNGAFTNSGERTVGVGVGIGW